jgi:hypothetical protein
MDPVERLAQTLHVDRARAEKGFGAVLSAVRVTLDKDGWEAVRRAMPDAEGYIGRSMMMDGGRTAEMASLTSPANLHATLARQGWKKDEVPQVISAVVAHLTSGVGKETLERFLKALPVVA